MIPIFPLNASPGNDKMFVFPDKQLLGKICLSPFVSADIGITGHVRICGCADWMPTVIGNINQHSLVNLINNEKAKLIKQSIIDGTYRYCNGDTCGIINSGQLNNVNDFSGTMADTISSATTNEIPREITLAIDKVCNLSCPSCRTHIINPSEEDEVLMHEMSQTLSRNLFSIPTDKEIFLTLSTTGEVFASPLSLAFLNNINVSEFPGLKLNIQTNGLLCNKRWHRLGDLQTRVAKVTVTIDASTKEVYEKLRRGGRWEDLLDNLEFLKELKKQNGMRLHTRMIVQRDNYQQMLDFHALSLEYDADQIEYSKIHTWDHLTAEQVRPMDVFDRRNPDFLKANIILEKLKTLPNIMISGGL